MDAISPKFRRRKAERPGEIAQAALAVFAEKGFAAARLDEIAARAGVSKGALYLYFATKEDLFRAVVHLAIAPDVQAIRAMVAAHPGPLADLLRLIPDRLSAIIESLPVGAVIKMVIGEARNFPELARVWYEALVSQALGAVTEAIAAAQARGEVRAGDPRIFAMELASPALMCVIWRETFTPIGAPDFDLRAVARQHVETMLRGMLVETAA
jgi:AcrR family transcriptional regulator